MFRSWETAFFGGIIIASVLLLLIYLFRKQIDLLYFKSFCIGVWIIPLYAIINLQQGMGKAFKNMTLAYLPNSVIRPIFVISAIVIISYLYSNVSSTEALAITLVGFSIAVAFQMIFLYKKMPLQSKEIRPDYDDTNWYSVSFALLLVASFYIFLNRTDVLMLGMMGSAADVGIYNAASRTSELVRFVPLAVNAVAAPAIAQLYAESKWKEMQDYAKKIIQVTFWPSLIICIGLYFLSDIIFGLFGHNFITANNILGVLLIGQIVNAGTGAVGYFLNMTGHQKSTARVFGWSAVINVVLNGIGISLYGAIGAALATTITLIIWNIWMHSLVKKKLNIHSAIIYSFVSRK